MALLDKLRSKGDSAENLQGIEFKTGDIIDQRYLVRDVRRGFMGLVYIARDLRSDHNVALKTFQSKFTWVDTAIANFTREAEVWMRLGNHQNIVQATRILSIAGRPHIVMEFVPGTSLRALMLRGRLRFQDILDFSIQICWGMQYAGDHCSIIHRDLKPDNVMITPERVAKVTDFGLAQAVAQGKSRWGHEAQIEQPKILTHASDLFGGSQSYMAPEQRIPQAAMPLGPWSDIYAMGVMLYELMLGELPFTATTVEEMTNLHCNVPPPTPSEVRPDLRRGCDHILLRCLAKAPADRYQSFSELELDLQWLRRYHIGEELARPAIDTTATQAAQWSNRGIAHMSLKEFGPALQCFRWACELEPQRAIHWINVASSQVGLLEYNEAVKTFSHALQGQPNSEEQISAYLQMGETYEHLYQLQKALECFDAAVTINSRERRAWLGRGRVYAALMLPRDSFMAFEQAMKLDPNDPQAWYHLGLLSVDLGEPRNALYYFDKALEINPRDARTWCGKGRALLELRRNHDALQAYETAYRLDPNLAEAVLGLSQVRGSRPLG